MSGTRGQSLGAVIRPQIAPPLVGRLWLRALAAPFECRPRRGARAGEAASSAAACAGSSRGRAPRPWLAAGSGDCTARGAFRSVGIRPSRARARRSRRVGRQRGKDSLLASTVAMCARATPNSCRGAGGCGLSAGCRPAALADRRTKKASVVAVPAAGSAVVRRLGRACSCPKARAGRPLAFQAPARSPIRVFVPRLGAWSRSFAPEGAAALSNREPNRPPNSGTQARCPVRPDTRGSACVPGGASPAAAAARPSAAIPAALPGPARGARTWRAWQATISRSGGPPA